MTVRIYRIAALAAVLLASTVNAGTVQEAIDHPGRPDSDRKHDDRRHPVETMTFAGVTGGEVILEIGAGQGYTTELVSRIVGPGGKVFAHALNPDRLLGNRLPNVVSVVDPENTGDLADSFIDAGMTEGGVDRVLAFFSLHDGYGFPENDMVGVYRALYRFLKPNGAFVVLDNSATPGTGLASVPTLHRIDEEYMKNEILKAGFKLESETDVLRNPDDDLDSSWFEDTETRKAGYQDRFALRFRK